MWLLLVGLTLLAGDVLSQGANIITDVETDILTVAKEQPLIHSRTEPYAGEGNEYNLSFETRLPGYENPLYAYSYTVGENTDVIKNVENKNEDMLKDSKAKLKYIPRKVLKRIVKIENPEKYQNTDYSRETEDTKSSTVVTVSELDNISSTADQSTPVDLISHKLSEYLPPDELLSSHETQNTLTLFEVNSQRSQQQSYNAPLSSKEDKTISQTLSPSFLPSDKKHFQNSTHTSLSLYYLSPQEYKSESLDQKKISLSDISLENSLHSHNLPREILPPDKIYVDGSNESKIPLDYLPPTTKPKSSIKTIPLNYLPPNEGPSSQELPKSKNFQDYLPPIEEKPHSLNPLLDYLPPIFKFSHNAPQSGIPMDNLPPEGDNYKSESLSVDFLLPDEISTLNKGYSLISLSDYLPPNEDRSNVTSITQDYLPPEEKSSFSQNQFSDIPIDYLPPNQDNSQHQELPPSQKITRPRQSLNDVTLTVSKLHPQSLSLDYLPPDKKSPIQKYETVSIISDYSPPEKETPYDQSLLRNYLPPHEKSYSQNTPLSLVSYDNLHPYPEASFVQKPFKSTDLNPTAISYSLKEELYENQRNPIRKIETLPPIAVRIKPVNQPIKRTAGPNNQASYKVVGIAPNDVAKTKFENRGDDAYHTPQTVYRKCPALITCQNPTVVSKPSIQFYSTKEVYASSHECLSNSECQEDEICMDARCVLGCRITSDLCTGDARCETRHHVPACICPLMSISKVVRRSGSVKLDCIPMMTSSSNIIMRSQTQMPSGFRPLSCFVRYPSAPLRPFAPISGFHNRPIVGPVRSNTDSRPIASTSSGYQSFTGIRGDSGNPCSPSPCGPNTRCETNPRGIALCRCIDDYVPDGNTINGCKPQCTDDGDCPDDYRCQSNKCARVCVPGACGLHANCDSRNHKAYCTCPTGFVGNPEVTCKRDMPKLREPPPALPVDPCRPNPCGDSAECKPRGERAVCSCPRGYEGDPLTRCIRGDCIEHNDCPNHLACQNLRCIDPCVGVCGNSADCNVRNHQPVCSCPRNHIGDPFSSCRRMTEYDVCNPSPCGTNTNCKARSSDGGLRAVCSCVDNYIGNPLTECRPECVRDTDCNANQQCRDNRCRNPCVDGCGEGAYCDVRNHRAVCTCPEYFQGDPNSRCYAECTAHEDCPAYQACSKFRCIDPCDGACGTGADCKVENHTPICSCPRGYTGDPFVSCRAFTLDDLCANNPCGTNADCTPGKDRSGNDRPVCTCPQGYIGNPLVSCQRGDCEDHNQCPDHEACYAYLCQSPCVTSVGSVCGENAECKVKNHQPVCSCPRGYSGDPLTMCRAGPGGFVTAAAASTSPSSFRRYQSRQSYENY